MPDSNSLISPLIKILSVGLLLLLSWACSSPQPQATSPQPQTTSPQPIAHSLDDDRMWSRVNELEQGMFERIWEQLDDPVSPAQAVEQFAFAQSFLFALSARPDSQAMRSTLHRASTPTLSPRMVQRFGPAYVRGWYDRVLVWQEQNKPALMARLGLNEIQVEHLLRGNFGVGSPWEHVLVAWGNPTSVQRVRLGQGEGLELTYGEGRLRRVLVADGQVVRVTL